jgi:mRNA interferase RelE/StbE
MASYRLVWKRSAEKELHALPREVISRLIRLAEALPQDPFPDSARKLAGAEHRIACAAAITGWCTPWRASA